MKMNFMQSWSENQDLSFGEMLEVARAAECAGEEKAREIRQHHKDLCAQVAAWEEGVRANPPKRVL